MRRCEQRGFRENQIDSKLNFSDFRTSVGYSFYKTSDKELGVGLGLHVLSYQASLSSTTLGTEGGNVLAPLPVVSLYGVRFKENTIRRYRVPQCT